MRLLPPKQVRQRVKPSPAGASLPVAETREMTRVLLTDDEKEFWHASAEALRIAKYNVCECASGEEAMARLKRETYDVVLTDFRMPGMSGVDLLREAVRRIPNAIFIVLTAYGSMESAIEA